MIKQLLSEYSQYITRDVIIFLITLSFVYVPGKMFELTQSFRLKNFLALTIISLCQYFCSYYLLEKREVIEFIIDFVPNLSATILLYVLVGFKLYDRVDDFFDKRFGKDKPLKIKRGK